MLLGDLRLDDWSRPSMQVLIGSILGDGCLRRDKRQKHFHYVETHAVEQTEYLRWKSVMMADLLPRFHSGPRRYSTGVRQIPSITTPTSPEFDRLHEQFYGDGRRKHYIPEWVGEVLDPLGLLIWYLDDGTRGYQAPKSAYPIITAKGWYAPDLTSIVMKLNERHRLSMTVRQNPAPKNRTGINQIIQFGSTSRDFLFPLWKTISANRGLSGDVIYKIA